MWLRYDNVIDLPAGKQISLIPKMLNYSFKFVLLPNHN